MADRSSDGSEGPSAMTGGVFNGKSREPRPTVSRLPQSDCSLELEGQFRSAADSVQPVTSDGAKVESIDSASQQAALDAKLQKMFKTFHDAGIEVDIARLKPHLHLFSAESVEQDNDAHARLAAICRASGLATPDGDSKGGPKPTN